MSEALSSSDIEDVVSSVRRLVSPEARPRPFSRDLGADRLILTPSLRIVAEQTVSGPAIVKVETVARKPRLKTRRIKARLLATPIVTEEGNEILPPAAAATLDTAQPGLSEMALTAEDAEVVGAETVTDLVPAKTRRKPVSKALAKPGRKPAVKAALPAKAPGQTKPVVGKARAARRPKAAPEPLMESPEAFLTTGVPFPDLGPEADMVPPVQAEAAADSVAQAMGPETAGAPVLTDAEGNPISVLDEDQLILLLRRVIREELQGGLGEKITRNVRKLVRAEINRALTVETLD